MTVCLFVRPDPLVFPHPEDKPPGPSGDFLWIEHIFVRRAGPESSHRTLSPYLVRYTGLILWPHIMCQKDAACRKLDNGFRRLRAFAKCHVFLAFLFYLACLYGPASRLPRRSGL